MCVCMYMYIRLCVCMYVIYVCVCVCMYVSMYVEQIEVRECLLSFGAESFVFQFAIQKFKD